MKKYWFLVGILLVALLAVGCGKGGSDYSDCVKVVYELEGGIYQNCERAVTQYYRFDGGAISPPDKLSGEEIKRTGFVLQGWYKTRTVAADGTVTYSEPWDFTRDTVGAEGVTLYACWKKEIRYTFDICYRDENGAVTVINSYAVDAGEAFDDYLDYADTRAGYTFTGQYRDADGNPLTADFRHPGGDTETSVQVFCDYIKGEYAIVRTAAELRAKKNANIYLMNDIDFGGGEFSGFGDYKGTIEGNGYTVSNFRLTYDVNDLVTDDDLDSEGGILRVALFRNVSGATVRNVTFSDFTVIVDTGLTKTKRIYVAPLCLKATGATFENVTVSGEWSVKKLPQDSFEADGRLTVITEPSGFIPEGDSSSFTSVTVRFTRVTD
ncbi:MAG TPA: hypothetical protein DDW30_06430 [Clostridiales bacterium]|nr:hypothetical protein [Clostridiales bacterium]